MTRSNQRPASGRGWGCSPRPGGRTGAGRDASATAGLSDPRYVSTDKDVKKALNPLCNPLKSLTPENVPAWDTPS